MASFLLVELMFLVLIRAVDISDGSRANMLLMPQQSLMEVLVESFFDKKAFQKADGIFTDLTQWHGVILNDEGEVDTIAWYLDTDFEAMWMEEFENEAGRPLMNGGSINLRCLPPSLREVTICSMRFRGSIETLALPAELHTLNLFGNRLCGSMDISGLPRALQEAILGRNDLHGTLDIPSLPGQLSILDLSFNKFDGSVDLTVLPETMEYIELNNNNFSGLIDLSFLPPSLRKLQLEKNSFRQKNLRVAQNLPDLSQLSLDTEAFDTITGTDGNTLRIVRRMDNTILVSQ